MDTGELFLFIALLAALVIIALQQRLHYKEKEDIFKKFMARDLHEAEYFKKKGTYEQEMKDKREALKHERDNPPSPEELARRVQAGKS